MDVIKVLKIYLVAFLFLTTACSSLSNLSRDKELKFNKPKIHLYLYSSLELKSEKYIAAFTSKGYEVEFRHGELPAHEGKSFIIHSPNVLNSNHYLDVENIINILNEIGFSEVNQYQYFLVKHSYTPGNVGVYLL
jgi:hypothetical protein